MQHEPTDDLETHAEHCTGHGCGRDAAPAVPPAYDRLPLVDESIPALLGLGAFLAFNVVIAWLITALLFGF